MSPYTPTRFYHCLESAVVSTVDKLCAAAELLGLVRPWAEAEPAPHPGPEGGKTCADVFRSTAAAGSGGP